MYQKIKSNFDIVIFLFVNACVVPKIWSQPSWISEGQIRRDNVLEITCVSQGISLELARNEAIRSCQSTASLHIDDKISVKTSLIETDKDSAYHSEVRQNRVFKGLNCFPLGEYFKEIGGDFKVWIRCKFDLSKVTSDSETIQQPNTLDQQQAGSVIEHRNITLLPNQSISMGSRIRDKQTRLSIATIPLCESILIKGEKPRVIRCSSNPENILLVPGDSELILRASGYEAKTIKLKNSGEPIDENISIIFD